MIDHRIQAMEMYKSSIRPMMVRYIEPVLMEFGGPFQAVCGLYGR